MVKTTGLLGSVLVIAGIVCLISGIAQENSEVLTSIGSALFSLGVLVAAAGIYIQARKLQRKYQPPEPKVKKTDKLCSSCSREPALVFCRVHVLRLCPECMDQHDDKSCSYVPATRAIAAFHRT
jgi:hypothetical protein